MIDQLKNFARAANNGRSQDDMDDACERLADALGNLQTKTPEAKLPDMAAFKKELLQEVQGMIDAAVKKALAPRPDTANPSSAVPSVIQSTAAPK